MNSEVRKSVRKVPDIRLDMRESRPGDLLRISWGSIKSFLRLPGEKFDKLKNYFNQIYVGIRWGYLEKRVRKFYFDLETSDSNLVPYVIEDDQIVILGVTAQICDSINVYTKSKCNAIESLGISSQLPDRLYKDVRVGFIYIEGLSKISDKQDRYMILAAKLGNPEVSRINAVRNSGYLFLEFRFKIADDKILELMSMDISKGD